MAEASQDPPVALKPPDKPFRNVLQASTGMSPGLAGGPEGPA
jgi:hypothetical protein